MTPIDEPAPFEEEGAASERRRARSPSPPKSPPEERLVSLTIEATTGRLVRVETVDSAGVRSELSDDLRERLAPVNGGPTVESIIEQAFEAGINCVLGDGPADDSAAEPDDDDPELRRALLRSLMHRSSAKRLMQREILSQAIIGTLMSAVADPRTSETAPH